MDTQQNDLEAFRNFVDAQVQTGSPLSPEELLGKFRAEQAPNATFRESVRAINAALDDLDAGDAGRLAGEVIRELRAKHGLAESP